MNKDKLEVGDLVTNSSGGYDVGIGLVIGAGLGGEVTHVWGSRWEIYWFKYGGRFLNAWWYEDDLTKLSPT